MYHYAKMSHMTLNAEKNEHYDRKKNELPLVHDKNQFFFLNTMEICKSSADVGPLFGSAGLNRDVY